MTVQDFYTRRYISRVPVNSDYVEGRDVSNRYVFISSFERKSTKRMIEHGRAMCRVMVDAGAWPGKTWEDFQDLPDDQFQSLAERYTHAYDNVERMDTTKFGADTTFQHDTGSFGTDTRKVFAF